MYFGICPSGDGRGGKLVYIDEEQAHYIPVGLSTYGKPMHCNHYKAVLGGTRVHNGLDHGLSRVVSECNYGQCWAAETPYRTSGDGM